MDQAGPGERFTLANLIIAIAAFGVLITGATTFARSWLYSASSNASAYSTAVEREGEIRRTHLAHIARCETPLGTTISFAIANTGQTSLQNFTDWDITVFYQSDGSQLATRLLYTDAATPSADEWTVSQILQPNGQEEVIERLESWSRSAWRPRTYRQVVRIDVPQTALGRVPVRAITSVDLGGEVVPDYEV